VARRKSTQKPGTGWRKKAFFVCGIDSACGSFDARQVAEKRGRKEIMIQPAEGKARRLLETKKKEQKKRSSDENERKMYAWAAAHGQVKVRLGIEGSRPQVGGCQPTFENHHVVAIRS
jgi:hypothetical protein